MKRFLVLFITFLMLLTMSPAFSEDIDISVLNYEEKLALYEELAEYFDKTFTLQPGVYEVGKDVKAGTYRFMYGNDFCTKLYFGTALNISRTDIDYENTTLARNFTLWNPYDSSYFFHLTEAYMNLKDGYYIVVEVGDVRMEQMDKPLPW